MRDPEGFSYKVISSGTTAFETTYEVDRIKNSTSYKLGRPADKGTEKNQAETEDEISPDKISAFIVNEVQM